jgi:hypothetical protein
MNKTTYHCDCCGEEVNRLESLQQLKISTERWSLDTELCKECFRPFEDARARFTYSLEVPDFMKSVYGKLKEIIKKQRAKYVRK